MAKGTLRVSKLNEISFVGTPCQEPALASHIKSAFGKGAIVKALGDIATSVTDNHQHAVEVYTNGESIGLWCYYAEREGDYYSHNHDIIRDSSGNIVLLLSNSHTHTIEMADIEAVMNRRMQSINLKGFNSISEFVKQAPVICLREKDNDSNRKSNNTENTPMTEQEKAEMERLKAFETRIKTIESFDEKTKSYFDSRTPEQQDKFVKLSPEARAAEVDLLGDPEIKSEDTKETPEQKEIKTLKAKIEKMEAESQHDKYAAQAAKLKHIGGDEAQKIATLKALDTIEDEAVRKQAIANYVTQNKALEVVGDQMVEGIDDSLDLGTHTAKDAGQVGLHKKQQEILKENPDMDPLDAYMLASKHNPSLASQASQLSH